MTLGLSTTNSILIGLAIVVFVMFSLWLVQKRTNDAGIVDVGWSALLGILAIWYSIAVNGYGPRRWLVGALAGIWSFRLAMYLLVDRVISGEEDGRYQAIRRNWSGNLQTFFFFFFQAQGLLDWGLAFTFLIAILNPAPELAWTDYLAVAVWLTAVLGESIADRQLQRFRRQAENRRQVCRTGLWRYSRHPNYFFEWLHWWTYVLLAVGSPYVWLTLAAPALMLFLILKVTGIPPTEARALESRGDAYREYQRTTSALIPWFPKENKS
jgi:steroid 5-alpha reductase family enzyme